MPAISVAAFNQTAHEHSEQSLQRFVAQVALLDDVDSCFDCAQDALEHLAEDQILVPLFFLQARSAFLSTVHLVITGQVVGSYALLRSLLEYGAYAVRVASAPGLRRVWLNRHESDSSKQQVKQEFHHRRLQESLRSLDPLVADEFDRLYDRAIDWGAHPNEKALSSRIGLKREDGRVQASVAFLSVRDAEHQVGIKAAFHAGVLVIDLFAHLYPQRFEIAGVTAELVRLRSFLGNA